MKVSLHFNAAKNGTHRCVEFKTIEEKNKYVDAENRNPLCKDAFRRYCAAWTKEERERAGARLDRIRESFYNVWTGKNKGPRPLKTA